MQEGVEVITTGVLEKAKNTREKKMSLEQWR